jgi:tetratricopeptide (TPR) repeat protein
MAILEAEYGRDDVRVLRPLWRIGEFTVMRGQLEEGLRAAERGLSILEHHLGPGHPTLAEFMNAHAAYLEAAGRAEDAIAVRKRGIAIVEGVFPDGDRRLAVHYRGLANALFIADDRDAARVALDKALEIGEVRRVFDAAHRFQNIMLCAGVLAGHGRSADAIEMLERGIVRHARKVAPLQLWQAVYERALLLVDEGRGTEAVEAAQQAVELAREPDAPGTIEASKFVLARALHSAGAEPQRARQLVAEVRAAYVAHGQLGAALLQDVDGWMASAKLE